MKKYVILFLMISSSLVSAFAQLEDDPKHENHFKYIPPTDTEKYSIDIFDVHAQQQFAFAKIRITNKTNDFLLLKSENIVFTIDGVKYSPKSKVFEIPPTETKTYNARVEGQGANMHVKFLQLSVNSIQVLSLKESISLEKILLPTKGKDIKADNFNIELVEVIHDPNQTLVILVCQYAGNKVGVFAPELPMITGAGNTWKNMTNKLVPVAFQPGEKHKFTLKYFISSSDIKANAGTYGFDWNGSIKEPSSIDIPGVTRNYEYDETLTRQNNK